MALLGACAETGPVAATPALSLADDGGPGESADDSCEPDCPNTEIAATAGAARIAGTTWTAVGPFRGGRLNGIVIATEQPDIGTMMVASPGGGVFRRRPGDVWVRVSDGLTDASVMHLELDLIIPHRVWASTWNSLYYTEDYGDSWTVVVNPSGLPRRGVVPDSNVVDPKPFAQLRFDDTHRAVFYGQACGGFWWSLDGEVFVPQDPPRLPGRIADDRCLGNIVADPLTYQVTISTLGTRGETDTPRVFRSSCRWEPDLPCLDWQRISDGLPAGGDRIGSLAPVTPAFPGQLLAIYESDSGSVGGTRAWRFDGAMWRLIGTLPSSQNQPRPLFLREGQLFHGNQQALWSGDLGRSWRQISNDDHHVDHRAMFPARRFDAVWSTTDGEGNGRDGRLGNIVRWDWPRGGRPHDARIVAPPRTTIQAYYVGVVPARPGGVRQLHVGTLDNEGFCRPDGGNFNFYGAPGSGDVFAFAVHPTSPNVAYALDNGFTLWSTRRAGTPVPDDRVFPRGACWGAWSEAANIPGGVRHWSRSVIAADPALPSRVYVAGNRTVFRSDRYGRGPLSDLGRPTIEGQRVEIFSIAVAGAEVLAGTDRGLFRGHYEPDSTTLTWVPDGLNEPVWPDALVVVAGGGTTGDAVWVGTTRGLYRQEAGTWSISLPPRRGDRDDLVSDVLVDPTCPTRIYAARGVHPSGLYRHGGGVLVSNDGGGTWTSTTDGHVIDNVPVADLDMDPGDPSTVYVATFGFGVWRLDWAQLPACGGGPQ